MPFINSEDQSIELSRMGKIPDVAIIIDVLREKDAFSEAKKCGIPVLAIVDTILDPNCVDYPIPGNDDAEGSIEFIRTKIADAVLEGTGTV